ncbi:MAG TPA: hypothetical protein VIK95_07185, partial [Egibacteraceae bacterium]
MIRTRAKFRAAPWAALLMALALLLAACGGDGGGADTEGGDTGTEEAADATEGEDTGADEATEGEEATEGGGPYRIGISNGFVGSEWRTQMIDNLETAAEEY